MPEFKDLYLSDIPVSKTVFPFAIPANDSTGNNKRLNTPLLDIKGLMVSAVKKSFVELEKTGRFQTKLSPSTVFGFDENGTQKYDEVGKFISRDVVDFLNDQYGSYKNNRFQSMYDTLFSTPIKVNGKIKYLRVYATGTSNVIYRRTHKKICDLFRQANYQIPLNDSQREQFKQIYRDAYYNLIEGIIATRNNQPVMSKGLHIIESKSDFQIALDMIKKNIVFREENFISNENYQENLKR